MQNKECGAEKGIAVDNILNVAQCGECGYFELIPTIITHIILHNIATSTCGFQECIMSILTR